MNRLMTAVVAALLAFGTSLSAQKPAVPNSKVWSLYRNSVTDATMRLHIATFDSVDDTGSARFDRARSVIGTQVLLTALPGGGSGQAK